MGRKGLSRMLLECILGENGIVRKVMDGYRKFAVFHLTFNNGRDIVWAFVFKVAAAADDLRPRATSFWSIVRNAVLVSRYYELYTCAFK